MFAAAALALAGQRGTMNIQTKTKAASSQPKPTRAEGHIIKLLDAWRAAFIKIGQIKKPELEALPVPCTIEQHRKISVANQAAQADYSTKLDEARKRERLADDELYRAIPSNTWIALPSQKISIGFETGSWGGGCHALIIVPDGEKLRPLKHQTHYP